MTATISSLTFIALIFAMAPVICLSKGACQFPQPSTNFTLEGYYGLWYEAAKIQTPGGAFFEKDCVCTNIDVRLKPDNKTGDCTALNSCRKKTPDGPFLNATGTLENMRPPGKWKEALYWFVPKVDYTVIYLDEDFAIEYDCGTTLGYLTNYCIHVMARTPEPDTAKVKQLATFAEGLGLNTDKLPLQWTKQGGCW